MSVRNLIFIVSILAAIIIALIIFFTATTTVPQAGGIESKLDYNVHDTIRFEIIKSLLELLTVAIIGGAVALIFKLRDETKEELKIRINFRMDYFNRLGEIYRNVKEIRRKLSAAGLTREHKQARETLSETMLALYITQMELLNRCQLALERLKIEARSLPAFVQLESVDKNLGTMEDYLRVILLEFEKYNRASASKAQLNLQILERLNEFTGPVDEPFDFEYRYPANKVKRNTYRFKKDFACLYSKVVESIGKNLTESVKTKKDENASADDSALVGR